MASVYAVPASLVISCLVSAGVVAATSEASQPAAVKQGGAYELKVAEMQKREWRRRERPQPPMQPYIEIERKPQPRPYLPRCCLHDNFW
jgi:hypothetical protein